MGQLFSKSFSKISRSARSCRVLILGLDNAGKSSILNQLKLRAEVETVPTVGFNVETVKFKNLSLVMWDCGGQQTLRSLWRHYFISTNALIYVVDAADPSRFDEARQELNKILESPEMEGVPILVIANKQDLGNAVTTDVLVQRLRLNSLTTQWNVAPNSTKNGQGLSQGLQWLSENIKETGDDSGYGTRGRPASYRS